MFKRWAGVGDRQLYWPKVLLATIAVLLPHLGCGCSTVGYWGLQADSHADILSLTDSNWLELPWAPGYIIVWHPLASAVLLLIYTGASLYWRLGRGSIYNTIQDKNQWEKQMNLEICLGDDRRFKIKVNRKLKMGEKVYSCEFLERSLEFKIVFMKTRRRQI